MPLRLNIVVLKVVLALAVAGAAGMQVVGLPWASGEVAMENPEVADMRWPLLALSVLGLGCVEVIAVAIWRLLDAVRHSRIFDARSYAWVDAIVWALCGTTGLSAVGFCYLLHSGQGPITVPGLALVGMLASLGALLLMIVMRGLLHHATDLQGEMDGVI